MRLWLLGCFLLVGCAGQKPIEQIELSTQVEPIVITLPTIHRFTPYSDYIVPLLSNLTQDPFYSLNNPNQLVTRYRYSHEVISSDPNKTVFAFEAPQNELWGYMTTSVGRKPIANAFLIQEHSLGTVYGLVLKQMKICLVSQANGIPSIRESKWFFPSQPGFFECTGMTNSNIFRVGTGLPGVLGPYFGEKDTVFIFRSRGQLQQVIWALKYQFPQLVIPVIES